MARRGLIAGLVLAVGSAAGALYYRQQRLAVRSEQVSLYFADGTLLEIDPDEQAATELLTLARELLDARPEPS